NKASVVATALWAVSGMLISGVCRHPCREPFVSKRDSAGHGYCPTRPTGPWLHDVAGSKNSRAIDRHDFTLVRPVFGLLNQAGAHGVLPNVIPFLTHAFVVPQHVIEKPLLPDLSG